MQTARTTNRQERGVTLIELVTVIVILGVLAAMVTPRFFDLGTFEERGFYEDVASALRYAQKIAIGSGCSVRVTITATSYDLRQQAASGNRCDEADATWTTQVLMPDGTPATATAPGSITLAPATNYVIDGLGQTDLGSDLTVTVGGLTMTVQTESGYVVVP